MPLTRTRLATLALLAMMIVSGGCGADTSPGSTMSGSGESDDESRSDGGSSTKVYRAKVVESVNVNVTIAGVTVWLLDRETGEQLESVVSNSQGEVALEIEGDDIGVLARAKPPLYTDTYGYGPITSGLVRVGTVSAAVAVPTTAGYEPDDEATPVAGNVVWVNPQTEQEEFVGCAEVSGEGAEDISYFSGPLPTAPSVRASTQPDRGNNDEEAGKYFVGNLSAPGPRTLTASIQGKSIGSVTFPTFPRKNSAAQELGGKQGHANLTLVSIYAETAENPTPADCK